MLSQADNELLTRVGPGTPMGNLLREYWQPVLYSGELEPDGNPERVRLLGEDLIAFRDTSGQVGLLASNCPHRGASLFFGRNEERGLRCVYHGWKFGVSGQCVDMPNEPPESNFKDRVRAVAYPCREYGGVIWTYMGPRSEPPALPELEWAILPEGHRRHAWRAIRECNWVQAMEGDLDTSHAFILHGSAGFSHRDKAPRLFLLDTDVGVMYGSRRDESPETYYWRSSQFLMPNITMFPADRDNVVPGHLWVPMDDEHSLIWCFAWHPTRELTDRELSGFSESGFVSEVWKPNAGPDEMLPPQVGRPYPRSWAAANPRNSYRIDRSLQRTSSFTGIATIPLQDDAMITGMGAIANREIEHLGTADAMIIRVRRFLLAAARALRDHGTIPPGVGTPAAYRKRSAQIILPREVAWDEALLGWHEARRDTLV
jgi:phthalate 4,5-dioxygenase